MVREPDARERFALRIASGETAGAAEVLKRLA
jgi:hypothetical protein